MSNYIDGHTQLVGLLGWPVEHSLSPAMHNAAFDAFKLNWRYVPLPVRPGQITTAVQGLAALGFRGANVTVPHKQAVIAALNNISSGARAIGAVNTLVVEQSEDGAAVINGHNTDDQGFIGALHAGGYKVQEGSKAVVVGAGGAARAIVFGLLGSGIGKVVVLNRTLARVQALAADLGQHRLGYAARLDALPLEPETLVESARAADLLVNATTVGMWPRGDESIWPEGVSLPAHLVVFDLVYVPLETRLLRQARASGANAVGGLGMLVCQGAIAFEMWTGQGPVDEIASMMRAACERVLVPEAQFLQ